MKKDQIIKFSLLENAKSSLKHAVTHLTTESSLGIEDYKYAVRDIVNAVELLFKEKLKVIHPSLMWSNVDKYPNKNAYTVNLDDAINRLERISGVKFTKKYLESIKKIKDLRNEIEHYEFEITEEVARTYIGRMLSFVFWFSYEYLNIDLEKEFRSDNSWSNLMNIYQFFEEHVAVVEDRMLKEQRNVTECPECGSYTFDIDSEICELCQESHILEECENCGKKEFSFKIKHVDKQISQHDYISEKLCENCADDGPCDMD